MIVAYISIDLLRDGRQEHQHNIYATINGIIRYLPVQQCNTCMRDHAGLSISGIPPIQYDDCFYDLLEILARSLAQAMLREGPIMVLKYNEASSVDTCPQPKVGDDCQKAQKDAIEDRVCCWVVALSSQP